MHRLQLQFFLSYAIFGCIGPLLPVYLKVEKGFTEFEIGINQALTSIATISSPLLITLLADLRIDPRRILGVSFLISGAAFYLISQSQSVEAVLCFYALHSLAFVPTIALQDGYYFTLASRADGSPRKPYHHVRVWGTAGFIVPSLAFYWVLERHSDLTIVLWFAISCGLLSALHAQLLPSPRSGADRREPPLDLKKKLPSAEALSTLLSPKARWFVLSLFLAFGASAFYHTFFPVYLRSLVQVKDSHIGLIINVGVFLEIFYILGIGRLRERFGMRALMIAGLSTMTLRLTLLAAFPSIVTALLTQIFHGLEICAVYVLPVMFLNQLASDRFRNSIQGVYTMLVVGGSRLVGGLVAGRLAEIDLLLLFGCAAVLAFSAALIMAFRFHPDETALPGAT